MRYLLAIIVAVAWSAMIALAINMGGFMDHLHDPIWSIGAAVILLIGVVGNVWLFFLIVKQLRARFRHENPAFLSLRLKSYNLYTSL